MSQSGSLLQGGGGGGGGITTINGDSGSITGATVTIYADNAANNSGSSVKFVNSGTVSTLDLTDASFNTIIGKSAGNATITGSENVAYGQISGVALTSGNNNAFIGYNAGHGTTSGSENVYVGNSAGAAGTTGAKNTTVGFNALGNGNHTSVIAIGDGAGTAYSGTEAENIVIGNLGTTGDNHVMRLGTTGIITGISSTFVAGITGATPTSANTPQVVVCDNAGQLTPINSSTAGFVLTSNGTATPSFQAAGGGGSTVYFAAYLSSTVSNVTGNGALFTVPYDTALTNVGGGFNTANGVFTAPSSGFYLFTYNVFFDSLIGSAATDIIVSCGGTAYSFRMQQFSLLSAVTTCPAQNAGSVLLPLNAGNTFTIQGSAYGTTASIGFGGGSLGGFATTCTFSGIKLV